jgi:hypothetical protein
MKHRPIILALLALLLVGAGGKGGIVSKTVYTEGSAPPTPAANTVIIYAKNNGLMYQKDDAGTERPLGLGDGVINEDNISSSVAGDGLVGGDGDPLDVNVDNSTLAIIADVVLVKDLGITTGKLADNAVTAAKIATSVAGGGLSGGGGTALVVNADGLSLEVASDVLQIKDQGVSTNKLADGAVNPDKLAASVAGDGLSGGGGTALAVNVDNSTLETNADTLRVKDLGITTGKLADSAVTAAKIANRTRYLWIPATDGYITGTGASFDQYTTNYGRGLPDAVVSTVSGSFYVPADYVSGGTIKAIGSTTFGAGPYDAYLDIKVYYSAVGETHNAHNNTQAYAAVSVSETRSVLLTIIPDALAQGDVGFISMSRDATHGSDTLDGGILVITGFLLEYTADS